MPSQPERAARSAKVDRVQHRAADPVTLGGDQCFGAAGFDCVNRSSEAGPRIGGLASTDGPRPPNHSTIVQPRRSASAVIVGALRIEPSPTLGLVGCGNADVGDDCTCGCGRRVLASAGVCWHGLIV